ncbi:hypothetical protein Q7P37_004742 [Cladosporium fusiforme]
MSISKPIRVLNIADCQSDGDRAKWPTADKGLTRNDNYFLEKIANEKWAKDRDHADLGGPPSIATWRLNKLPDGYAGFEKFRTDSIHVDRYVYGHPRGMFRSLAEFYPHFKHLMDHGGAAGCQCKLCSGDKKRASYGKIISGATNSSNGARSASPAQKSSYFTQSQPSASKTQAAANAVPKPRGRPSGLPVLPHGRLKSLSPTRQPRKQIDEDGTPDVIRELLNELKAADEGAVIDRKIEELLSPDWRAGHELVEELLDDWRQSPRFMPRAGELVLFVRDLEPNETLSWDEKILTYRKFDENTGNMLDLPKWEAGVITQMPLQTIDENDLTSPPDSKSNVVNSGFRIQPLSQPGSKDKIESRQHRYVPLHGIRPLVYWHDCLRDLPEPEWHPTIKYALSVTNTFCVLARDRFKGVRDGVSGPEATVFCHGAYIGSELILKGDVVRLLPNPDEQKPNEVTDVIVVTAIKLRLINIQEAGDDDWDDGRPYMVCLHISGRPYTSDPRRSFDRVNKVPTPVDSRHLPSGLHEYGQFYFMIDPAKTKGRLEVPFTRILSRVSEGTAMESWFSPRAPSSSFQAVNTPKANDKSVRAADIRRGVSGLTQARAHAYHTDTRIDKAAGKTWFWAETRVEALDLHEMNNRFVGPKDTTRTRKQMDDWRKALKALDGSKSGLADYHAAMKQREVESRKEREGLAAGSYGMVAAAVADPSGTSGSGTEGEVQGAEDNGDMMDVDVDEDYDDDDDNIDDYNDMKREDTGVVADATAGARRAGFQDAIELSDDDESDD